MPDSTDDISLLLNQVPPPDVIRQRITTNVRERKLLGQLLRIAEQRERSPRVQDVGRAGRDS